MTVKLSTTMCYWASCIQTKKKVQNGEVEARRNPDGGNNLRRTTAAFPAKELRVKVSSGLRQTSLQAYITKSGPNQRESKDEMSQFDTGFSFGNIRLGIVNNNFIFVPPYVGDRL